jgi:HAD superfamily hydrolase (TIGR01549 family)
LPTIWTFSKQRLKNGAIETIAIPGARDLLNKLQGSLQMGIATANLLRAAKLRLQSVEFWNPISAHAFGADGGGHKRQILARAIASTGLPKNRIVYIGDNRDDVEAGLSNGVHFVGFSTKSRPFE